MEITIKVGRKEYQPQAGDYILWNGACYQFCTGDGRTLYSKKVDKLHCCYPFNGSNKKDTL